MNKNKKEGKNIAKAHAAVEKRPYILQDAVSAPAESEVRQI